MESSNEVYNAVVDYFTKHQIDIESIKINYRTKNRFKVVDAITNEPYTIGIKKEKFYMTKVGVDNE